MGGKGGAKSGRAIPKQSAPQSGGIAREIPKQVFVPRGSEGTIRVRFGDIDVGGPFCITTITPEHFAELIDRIKSFETMSYNEVFNGGSGMGKSYEVAKIPNTQARNRLTELKLDDQTEISRLHISGRRRLYGFMPNGGPDFYALWWDPEHVIWPSLKKHT